MSKKRERAGKEYRDHLFSLVPMLDIEESIKKDIKSPKLRDKIRKEAKEKIAGDKPYMVKQIILNEVLDLLLNHNYTHRMLTQYMRLEWGLENYTTRNYIRQARDIIDNAFDGSREDLIKQQLIRLNELYNMAMKKNRFETALKALEHQNKLLFETQGDNYGLQILNIQGETKEDTGITINLNVDNDKLLWDKKLEVVDAELVEDKEKS